MDNNRISINTLTAAPEKDSIFLEIGGATIEVKPHVSTEELMATMEWVVNVVCGDNPFISAPLLRMVKDFAIIGAYTNLDCSIINKGQDMSEIYREYDVINSLGIMENIVPKLDAKQIAFFETMTDKTLESIIAYRNSAKGIVDALAADAKLDTKQMEEAMDILNNPNKQEQIKTIIETAKAIQG